MALENSSGGKDWFKNSSLLHHRSQVPVSRDILSLRERHRKPDKKIAVSLSVSRRESKIRLCSHFSSIVLAKNSLICLRKTHCVVGVAAVQPCR